MDQRVADAVRFDPFELPDTIQLGGIDDPYPYLAAARRQGSVTAEWPFPGDVVALDEDAETLSVDRSSVDVSFNVVGHDDVMTVLRDHETYSSTVLSEIMGPMLDHTMIAMDEPEHRAHRALVAPAFRPKLLARWQEDLVTTCGRRVDRLLRAARSCRSRPPPHVRVSRACDRPHPRASGT